MYRLTLNILKSQNQQLWFTINLRLGKIMLDQDKTQELEDLIHDLKESCKKPKDD